MKSTTKGIQVYALATGLHVHRLSTGSGAGSAVQPPWHHVLVLDVSGSMTWTLESMREHVSTKLGTMIGEDDLLSMVCFSGRGEVYELCKHATVKNLRDLQHFRALVERWLKPVGLTGFREPFEHARQLMNEAPPKYAHSLMFLSDGCDNQWSRQEIMTAFDAAQERASATTIVEYGYYADRALMQDMAARARGQYLFADQLPGFQLALGRHLGVDRGKKIEVEIAAPPSRVISGHVFSFDEKKKEIRSYRVEEGGGKSVVTMPEGEGEVFYVVRGALSGRKGNKAPKDVDAEAPLYAAMAAAALRGSGSAIYELLAELGDVRLIDRAGGLFGKQAYSEFAQMCEEAVFDKGKRLADGFDRSRVPPEEAFTVLDLLTLLEGRGKSGKMMETQLLLSHKAFSYSKISLGRDDADGDSALKFEPTTTEVGITSLTYNKDRANVSVQTRQEGVVDLGSRLPLSGEVPQKFLTHRYRNYAIVKDGMRNVEQLPVRVGEVVLDELKTAGVAFRPIKPAELPIVEGKEIGHPILIDLRPLPVMCRADIKAQSAVDLCKRHADLLVYQAAQKVFKDYRDRYVDSALRRGAAIANRFSPEAATWLGEQGFTDNGFAPKSTVQREKKDYYLGKLVTVSIKGFAGSLPSVAEVRAKMEKQKQTKKELTGLARLMQKQIATAEAFIAGFPDPNSEEAKKQIGERMSKLVEASENNVRTTLRHISKMKLVTIVGQEWFSDLATVGEGVVELPVTPLDSPMGGNPLRSQDVFGVDKLICTVAMEEEKVYVG